VPNIHELLDWPLIGLSETDRVTVRQSVEGIFVSGAPGSGKSANVGAQWAHAFLHIPKSGALILTAKSEETENWIGYARKCGRADDLIIFDEKSGFVFDPLAYEWNRPGRGAGDVENILDFFLTLIALGQKEISQGHDPFWQRGSEQLIRNVIKLLDLAGEPISIVSIDRCIKSLATIPGQHEDEAWREGSYCAQLVDAVKARRETLTEEQWSDLDFATVFIFQKWPAF
jgi:hypothetical protein